MFIYFSVIVLLWFVVLFGIDLTLVLLFGRFGFVDCFDCYLDTYVALMFYVWLLLGANAFVCLVFGVLFSFVWI